MLKDWGSELAILVAAEIAPFNKEPLNCETAVFPQLNLIPVKPCRKVEAKAPH
jgi:hypothetical protein